VRDAKALLVAPVAADANAATFGLRHTKECEIAPAESLRDFVGFAAGNEGAGLVAVGDSEGTGALRCHPSQQPRSLMLPPVVDARGFHALLLQLVPEQIELLVSEVVLLPSTSLKVVI